MKLVSYNPTQKAVWNQFLATCKNGLFMFNRDYMDYHSDRFTDHSLMAYDDTDKLIALLPASIRDGVLYSHQGLTFGGFLTPTGLKASTMLELFENLRQHMQQNSISKLVYKAIPYIYSTQPAEEDRYALFRNNARLFRVDISTTVNQANRLPMSDLRKRGTKKALAQGLVVEKSTDFAGFMAVLTATLQTQHDTKPVHSLSEVELLASRFPNNIHLYVAKKDDQIQAGTLIFEHATLAHAQYIAASPDGRNTGALDILFTHLIENIFAHKAYFDFGISTEEGGTVLNNGLISQKEGFGGRAVVHEFYEITT